MRNLTKTLAVVSLLAPTAGYSLGIGDIKLHSSLNQNLDAEVSLIVSANEKISDLKVHLAPPDKFDEAGVPWDSFLSKIKFETKVDANGSVIIKLSSKEAVKEPFLDFLLEVNWPKGTLYREFTVLLDPPTAYKQATIPVLTSPESYKPKEQALLQQNPSIQNQQTRNISEASYVPTHKNDSLWKVAERVSKRLGVSVEQMMIAMYEKNPHAFYKENINALMAGKTLKIPETDVVLRLSRKQALAEFNRQTNAWKNHLASVPIEATSAEKETPDNQLTLAAPTQEADVAQNEIITPENKQLTANDTASKPIDKRAVNIISPVDDALQDKVVVLEKQLAMMQQILALKDQQLAALQNQNKLAVQPEAIQATSLAQTGIDNREARQKPVQPDVKSAIQPDPKAALSPDNYFLWVSGVGAGALSLFGLLWRQKRKLDERAFAYSSISKTPESMSFFSTSTEKDNEKNADTDDKSSFFTELTFGNFDTFDTDQSEIDPISEADVYLAYGRHQQAEELLREVIKDQPSRDECKLKLLEVFYSNENRHAFETYANELAKAGKKDDVEFWTKVTEMGNVICRDTTLFCSEADEFTTGENTIFEKETVILAVSDDVQKNGVNDIKRINLGLSSFGTSFNNEAVKETLQTTDSLLNLDRISFENEVEVIDEAHNNESIDFEFGINATKTIESNETFEIAASKTQDIEVNHDLELFNLGFDSNETKIKGIDEIDTSRVKESDRNYHFTDSLADKSFDLNSNFAHDSVNRSFYFDRPTSELNVEDFGQQSALDVFDLTDMDELETKLDLAKAYIDMSDTDAAKDMACEVLEKGTVEQKKIAQALLNGLE